MSFTAVTHKFEMQRSLSFLMASMTALAMLFALVAVAVKSIFVMSLAGICILAAGILVAHILSSGRTRSTFRTSWEKND